LPATKSQQLLRKRGSLFGGRSDRLSTFQDLRLIGQATYSRNLGENHHQKIVEIVRDSAYQPADNFHFVGLPSFFLEAFALSDIPKNSLDQLPARKFDHDGIDFDGQGAAVGVIYV
jgi:hypothetical protein